MSKLDIDMGIRIIVFWGVFYLCTLIIKFPSYDLDDYIFIFSFIINYVVCGGVIVIALSISLFFRSLASYLYRKIIYIRFLRKYKLFYSEYEQFLKFELDKKEVLSLNSEFFDWDELKLRMFVKVSNSLICKSKNILKRTTDSTNDYHILEFSFFNTIDIVQIGDIESYYNKYNLYPENIFMASDIICFESIRNMAIESVYSNNNKALKYERIALVLIEKMSLRNSFRSDYLVSEMKDSLIIKKKYPKVKVPLSILSWNHRNFIEICDNDKVYF